ncbi:complex I subunit 4 family protein [Tuwongella immobilis]|uniref:NADH:quinone oxidoreductase/Mrp antiporter transmembrane domain-containing protein n=1 Tax=Tuwongella immobilis TaxID=692036 RepID=A0A6C2YID6_9BACT|nr:NADH-quinone oxidoreductase subunit M [Tuwongella immobilis]VIP00903.1 proton-translocating nadh-quinone oxidoreductase subunit m : Proton-translocating NADH-quinone oxidoreductase, chain M OS=Planctomyces limnophilus (strain ATCC 43296 / DSM 3776 / IFAM 1008 / 290) GN=Plim_3869 PE=4 SV=1: Oxidored_q1 [Tuwongella immobilis]VTR97224.1 proton-translocating nadh-quinone oxidoreductase subunit m : Proton-translocating NADH-quinone oxidoreductase, chain M OS=Planctomyces limnophilus (strain ATCC 43
MPNESLYKLLVIALLALPVVAAAVVMTLGRTSVSRARMSSLLLALVHLGLTLSLVFPVMPVLAERTLTANTVFDPILVTKATLLPIATQANATGVQFFIGIDGLNLWLVALSSVMMIPVILVSWHGIQDRAASFYAWLFLLQSATIGLFLAFDLVLFYAFFELTLIPMFFLIGQWGIGAARRDAARKFFLYTLAGSLITLVGLVGTVLTLGGLAGGKLTFAIPELVQQVQTVTTSSEANKTAWANAQVWLFIALLMGFAVKIPIVPLHSWLPSAYSESPAGVTVFLSALLAKMGTFGLLRVVMPLTPDATLSFGLPVVGSLAAFAILYGALVAYAQTDMKKMIAYSSISHLAFCVLALMAFNTEGMSGGLLHMVNHGISTGALFVLVGLMVDRYSTHSMASYSGLMTKLPIFSLFMMILTLASIGLPGLCNFVSEMLMLGSLFDMRNPSVKGFAFAGIAGFGIFLSAWYMLTMIQRVFFGPVREPIRVNLPPAKDLNSREIWAVAPLVVLCVLLGCKPQPFLQVMKPEITALSQVANAARDRVPTTSPGQTPTGSATASVR